MLPRAHISTKKVYKYGKLPLTRHVYTLPPSTFYQPGPTSPPPYLLPPTESLTLTSSLHVPPLLSSPPSTSTSLKSNPVVLTSPCGTRSIHASSILRPTFILFITSLFYCFSTLNLLFPAAAPSLFDSSCIWNEMKNLKRHPLSLVTDLRKIDAGEKALCHESLVKFKNARQRRLRIRRLKYICEAKIQVGTGDRSEERNKRAESDNISKDREIHESMEISLSLTTTTSSKDKEDRSMSRPRDDAVLAGDLEELSYGSVSVIGSRKEMEDAVSIEMGIVVKERVKCDFFAVYDGHGGPQVAKACRERLYQLIAEEVERRGKSGSEVDWEGVMEGCFGKMDSELADDAAVRTVGSTAVVAVVAKEEVVVANCGDCRAVMGRGGEAFALSNDHKPDRPDELMRIEAAGGRVINWNGQRVLGVLATSRSIGDQYLRPYVISKPEVTVTKRSKEDEFLILASDGLWDVISSEAACQVVRKCLNRQTRRNSRVVGTHQSLAADAAALLAELAMARGSRDNTSVIVVELRNQNN